MDTISFLLTMIANAGELVQVFMEHIIQVGVICHKDVATGVVIFILTRMVIVDLVVIRRLNIVSVRVSF